MRFKSDCEFFQRNCEIPNTAEAYPCSGSVKLFGWSFEKTLMILDTKTAADLLSFEKTWRLWNVWKPLFFQQMAPGESPILARGQVLLWGAAWKTHQLRITSAPAPLMILHPSPVWFTFITDLILNSTLNLQNRKHSLIHSWAITELSWSIVRELNDRRTRLVSPHVDDAISASVLLLSSSVSLNIRNMHRWSFSRTISESFAQKRTSCRSLTEESEVPAVSPITSCQCCSGSWAQMHKHMRQEGTEIS